jgi:hypothetical protein
LCARGLVVWNWATLGFHSSLFWAFVVWDFGSVAFVVRTFGSWATRQRSISIVRMEGCGIIHINIVISIVGIVRFKISIFIDLARIAVVGHLGLI